MSLSSTKPCVVVIMASNPCGRVIFRPKREELVQRFGEVAIA